MKKLLELNRLLAQADTLSQGVVKSHFNLLWEKHHQETEDYRFLWQNGIITQREFNQVTSKSYNHVVNEAKRITKKLI